MSKFRQSRWVWNNTTGETELSHMSPGDYASIIIRSGNNRIFALRIKDYQVAEDLKPTPHQSAAEKQATARLRFHLAEYQKQERKKYAAVAAACKDVLNRMRD